MNERGIAALGAALAASLIGASGAQAQSNDFRIIYGQRAGDISLGMSAAQVLQLRGAPGQTNQMSKGGMMVHYSDLGIVFDQNQRVVRIYISSPQYVTPEGLHYGDSTFVLQVKHPGFKWQRTVNPSNVTFCYPDRTMFETDPQRGVIIDIALNACTP